MWQYVFHSLRRQPSKSVLASSGFLLTACALILLSATTQATVVQASQIINQNWRSTYDLVVLPPQAHPSQRGTLIPADLLEGYDGGISMQQYHQIQHIPGVAIAAPIAYVGYVKLPVPTIRFTTNALPSGYYRLDWSLTAFNGRQQVVEYQESSVILLTTSCQEQPSQATLNALLKLHVVDRGCGFQSGSYPFPSPETGTFLLAAIDPAAENQLVGLNKSIVRGRPLTETDTLHIDQRFQGEKIYFVNSKNQRIPVYSVPMVIHTHLPGQISLHATFVHLAAYDVSPQQVLAHGGAAYLTHLTHQQTLFHGQVPLVQNDPQRFAGASLVWNGEEWQTPPFNLIDDANNIMLDFNSSSTPSGLTYQSATSSPEKRGASYTLVPTGGQGSETTFRVLHPLHVSDTSEEGLYDFEPVGQLSGDSLPSQFSNPLNWLPENTYSALPVTMRYDSHGNPVTPTLLIPTTNTAGYMLQPPLALTTLATAVQLRGDHIISAIRVRVAGVDRADPDSWKQIQKIAASIEQQTHLHVLVTLGSSPSPVLVYIPGIKQGQFGVQQSIEPLGWVEERWISLGAAIIYLQQLGATRLLLLGAVLAVCLGYLVVALSALATTQRKEFAVLNALGWRPWQPVRLFLTQVLLLALSGGLLGLVLGLLLSALLGAIPLWAIVVWTLPSMLILALIAAVYPLWQLWHIQPAEMLRTGSSVSSVRATLFILRLGPRSSLTVLVLRNLMRSRPRTLITMGSLFFSAILLMLMFSSILALRQTLMGTFLGDFILLQTAITQLAGCIFAVLLTFLNVADLLLLQARERQQEIGLLQAIGWRLGLVQRLFMQEGVILALISTLPGVLVAQWILVAQHTFQNSISSLLIALGTVLFMIGVAALATLPALHIVKRMPIVEVLRAG